MGLASEKYDILLNGKGYILIEESYHKRAQQAFTPRFSTGEYGMGDLSFWQFLAIESFLSQEQEIFNAKNLYRQSAGWDIRDGRPKLARGVETISLTSALPGLATVAGDVLIDNFESGFGLWTAGGASADASGITSLGGSNRGYTAWNTGGRTNRPRVSLVTRNSGLPTYGSYVFTARLKDNVADIGFAILNATDWKSLDTGFGIINYYDVNGGYAFFYGNQIGPGSTAAVKVYRIPPYTLAAPGDWDFHNAGATGVLIATLTATAKVATDTVIKISRAGDGTFTVYQDGVSLGTVLDNTYTGMNQIAWTTDKATGAVGDYHTIDDIKYGGLSSATTGLGGKFVQYRNSLYTAYLTSASAFTLTTLKAASAAANLPALYHLAARDICVWSRDGDISSRNQFLCAVDGNNTLKIYDDPASAAVYTLSPTGLVPQGIVPVNSTTLLLIGTDATNSGIPCFQRLTFSANSWTLSASPTIHGEGGNTGSMVAGYAFDSAGVLHVAISDLTGVPGRMPPRIYRFTATDLLATNMTISQVQSYPDFLIRHLTALNGAVYLIGAVIDGKYGYHAVDKYPATQMYKSTYAADMDALGSAGYYNAGIGAMWVGVGGILFLGYTDQGIYQPVLELDASGNVREVASFNAKQFTYTAPVIYALAEWNGRFYLLNSQDGTVQRTLTTRGGLSGFTNAELQLSDMGGNTPLIKKSLYSVIIELSQALPAGQTLTPIVNGVSLPSMLPADGTYKELAVTSEVTANTFTPKLRLLAAQGWNGYLKRVALKYVPVQLKKRAWGFGVRMDRNLKDATGARWDRTPDVMAADLLTAWQSNVPVSYTDIDGTAYQVIVTDFDDKRPLLNRKGGVYGEGFIYVELLEV